MTNHEVGERLCELCEMGENLQAIEELYAEDVISTEAAEGPDGAPRTVQGKAAVRAKTEWWLGAHEVHDAELEGPFPHGEDKFAVLFDMDVTNTEMDQRYEMTEVAVYTVKDGKVVREEFFYSM